MSDLEKAFAEITVLKGLQGFSNRYDKDFRHATEELGEVAKAMRDLEEIDNDNDDCLSEQIKARQHLQEEIVDLAICCIALFIGSGGKLEEFPRLLFKKIAKWRRSLKRRGLG